MRQCYKIIWLVLEATELLSWSAQHTLKFGLELACDKFTATKQLHFQFILECDEFTVSR